jgi:uncharacterized protein involved in outer membrane biogenesis
MAPVGLRLPSLPARRLWLIVAVVAAGGVALVLLLASLLLPDLVRRAAVDKLRAQVTAPVRIEKVSLNIFTGRARVTDIVIGGEDGGQPILKIPALDLALSYRALLRGAARVRYLTFHDPRLFVERTGPESVNIVQILKPSEGGQPAPVTIDQVEIRRGAVTFVDRTQSPAFERTFTAVNITTGQLSTLPELRLTPTSFEARLTIGQGALVVTGAAAPFGRPSGVELVARMERLDPGMFRGYLPLKARVDLRGSWVNGEVRYVLAYRGDQPTTNALTARVETGPIRFLPPDGDTPIVSVTGLAGQDIAVDFLANRMRLGDVVLNEPSLALERNPDGTFNLMRLIEATTEPAPTQAPSSPTAATRQHAAPAQESRPLAVTLVRGRIAGGAFQFTDRTMAPAAATALQGIELSLQDLGIGPGARPGRVEGEARLGGGRVRLVGTADAQAMAGRLRIDARGVPIDSARRYLEAALPGARARGGSADASLDLTAARREDGTLAMELAGSVDGRNLALALPGAAEPTVRAGRLRLELARLALAPTVFADVNRLRLSGGVLRVTRDRDGNLDVARLWAPPAATSESQRPPPAEAASGEPPRRAYSVRRVEVAATRVYFTDAGVSPAFVTSLDDLRLDLRQSPGDAERMTLLLRAMLDPSAPLEFRGWVTPFASPLRLRVEGGVRDYELSRLDPYAVRYVSHHLERGRVTTQTAVSYEAGRFQASNQITVEHIQVGEEVDPELRQGLGIPLKLAVSLLERPDGDIRLDVPLTGDAEGVHFQLGAVIREALRNTLVKAVEAPFRAFGSLLTLGGKIGQVRIDPVEFRAGSLEPNDEASARLDKVIAFLKDRPKVELQLSGLATSNELEPLKRERLRARLKSWETGDYDSPLEAAYHEAGAPFTHSPPPADEMERYVLDRMELDGNDLRQLSEERARVVQEALVRRGIDRGRLFVVKADRGSVVQGGLGRVEFKFLY